ncbi:MAG: AMP-binding protein [Gammaproteobacteria bacterium]
MMDTAGLNKNRANYVPLSPVSFLLRTARAYPQRTAIIYGRRRLSWSALYSRCARMAASLAKRGIQKGDVVSFVAANTPELVEAHFAVPMAGAVLNAVNVRLDIDTMRHIFEHGEAKMVFVDGEFSAKVGAAVAKMKKPPVVIDIPDDENGICENIGACDYETLLAESGGEELCIMPDNEWQPITLNYTSGTTGKPKGVVYHHRGAYLMAMGSIPAWDMQKHGVYIYSVPMFHCNGWGYAWTQTLLAGTIVCLRKVDGGDILRLIQEHKADSLGGAPVVLAMLAEAVKNIKGGKLPHAVKVMTAGAPPPPAVLAAVEEAGFSVTHVYGLTETFGHTTICAHQEEWESLPPDERAQMQAQQGVGYPILQDWAVLDSHGNPLPADGKSMGEIALRGNTIMRGYLKDPQATAAAFCGEWFLSGDLAVMHPSGYLQIKDRLKDVIISGGENISSVAVEAALCAHPSVLLAAVVAKPDDKWGETPCAFVELRRGAEASAEELMKFCRAKLAGYMRPRYVIFGELPKTATGKIQKYQLRERAKTL